MSIRSEKDAMNISDLAVGSYWMKATSTMGTVTSNFVKK
jgi:hypothetical protein